MTPKDNVRGIVWLTIAMAAYAIEDALFKSIIHKIPVGQALILFSFGGALFFGTFIRLQGRDLIQAEVRSMPMLVRSVCEVIGRLSYLIGLGFIPLSTATVIIQSIPIVMLVGAVVFFKEKIGIARWIAVILGLIGVLIVLNPDASSFSIYSLLIVVSVLGFAGRDLASRKASPYLSTLHLGFYGFLSVLLASGVFFHVSNARWMPMDNGLMLLITLSICVGVSGYFALMKAMRTGEISIMMLFRYTRLVFGVSIGMAVFNEKLYLNTLIGSGIIVASGLMIWFYEARPFQRQ